MIICDNLTAFVDGEISPVDHHAFSLHLIDCEFCRERLVEEQQLSARLSEIADRRYHLRVARAAKIVEPNVLWFDWCGYVYAEPSGTYDLSIFLRNCAIGGALCAAFDDGAIEGYDDAAVGEGFPRSRPAWVPGCKRDVPRGPQ